MWSANHIDESDNIADLLKLLRYLRRDYKCLIPQWEMREKMFWADGVKRAMRLQGKDANKVDLRCLVDNLKSYLSGNPMFKFAQSSTMIDNLFENIKNEHARKMKNEEGKMPEKDTLKKQLTINLDLHQSYYLEVEEWDKVIALCHIVKALRPSRMRIVISKTQSEDRQKILELFKDCSFHDTCRDRDNYKILYITVNHRSKYTTAEKLLWVVFDSSIPEELFEGKQNSLTVFLRTPNEPKLVSRVPEFSPLSYVSFREEFEICAVQRKRSPHPSTTCAHRNGFVYIVIEAPAAKNIDISLNPDGKFKFSAMGHDDLPYKLDLELFDAVNVEESKLTVGSRTISYLIKMADHKWWPRLLKKEDTPFYLKLDAKLDIRAAIADAQG